MPLPTWNLQFRINGGITNYNKDPHAERPMNIYAISKARKMTHSLERNYRDCH